MRPAYFKIHFRPVNSGSTIEYPVRIIAAIHPKESRKPLTYCDDGTVTLTEKNENKGIQAALPIRYCAYKNPAISIKRSAALSGTFIVNLFSFLHSRHSSRRERLTQNASSPPESESTQGDLHQLQQRFSFSFRLSTIYRYYSLIARKYGKVRNVNIRVVVLLGR